MKTYTAIVLFSYIFVTLLSWWLRYLNLMHLKKYGAIIPPGFEGHIDSELLRKTSSYTVDNSRLAFIKSIFENIILLLFLFGGLLNIYNSWILSFERHFLLSGLAFFLLLLYADTFISIPLSLYSTFSIEKKYGFNTVTLKLWVTDFLKALAVSTILFGILITAGLGLIRWSPAHWWLWVWAFFLTFSLAIMYIYPYIIAPLFNKFSPVDDRELEAGIRGLAEKSGIKVGAVFKMDASKRSRHTNAYFTGIGRVKRIVLFDTLLKKLNKEEILAVLAHEIGHWKKKHVLKRIIVSEVMAFAMFYISFRILQTDFLLNLFSIEADSFFAKIIILGFLGGIVMFPFSPLSSYLSRRHERQADRFACALTGNPESMASSLIKLSKDNLSNLHPHPLYAKFYYSHPPVVERVREIRNTVPAAG